MLMDELITEMSDRIKSLKSSSDVTPFNELSYLKGQFQRAMNDANMIQKLAAEAQEELDYVYKRLVDPAGWSPNDEVPKSREEQVHDTFMEVLQPMTSEGDESVPLKTDLITLADRALVATELDTKIIDAALKDYRNSKEIDDADSFSGRPY